MSSRSLAVGLATLWIAASVQAGAPTVDEERSSFRLADPQLTIELVVAEPLVRSPVAIAWDEDGALFVAEMTDYPDAAPSGRIKRLVDTDEDGLPDAATVFAEGLPCPNSVLPWSGGVLVTAAPDLWYLQDTDGDGRADVRRVVLTGFTVGNSQLRANGLTWGLDNWIYGANGRSGGAVRRPNDPPERSVSIARNDFRFDPRTFAVEAIAGFSQFGLPRDDWGDRFPSWNTVPIRHVVIENQDLGRTADTDGVASVLDMTDGGRLFPIAPPPLTFNGEPYGTFNASCGPTLYRGELLPGRYQGNAFVCEPLTSLVHRRVMVPDGPTYSARRADDGREFLASTHSWFRPVNLTTGPDGALHVVDYCRALVEHPAFVAEALRDGVDFREGNENGRIWRVRPKNAPAPSERPRLRSAASGQLVPLLAHPNGWWRDTAQRLLIERHDESVVPLLRSMAMGGPNPLGRIHALWVLKGLGRLDGECVASALAATHARVREHGLKLADGRAAESRGAILALADDPDARVRFHCALVLGELEGPEAIGALARVAARDVEGPWSRRAVLSGVAGRPWPFLSALLERDGRWIDAPTSAQAEFLGQLGSLFGPAEFDGQLGEALAAVERDAAAPGALALLAGTADGLARAGRPLASLRDRFGCVAVLLSAARAAALDAARPVEVRAWAARVLARSGDRGAVAVLADLLDARLDQRLQSEAARGIAANDDPELAGRALETWGRVTSVTRRELMGALAGARRSATVLLSAIEADSVPLDEVTQVVREALRRHPEAAVREHAERLFPKSAGGDRGAVVRRLQPVLGLAADAGRGQALFERHCSTCHERRGKGHRVGPNLDSVAGRPKLALLTDLLDPNREVAPDAVSYVVLTRDGRVLDGLLAAETAEGVRLRRAEGAEDVVPRSEVAELRGTGRSLMPEGLEQTLSEQDLADLIEFLSGTTP